MNIVDEKMVKEAIANAGFDVPLDQSCLFDPGGVATVIDRLSVRARMREGEFLLMKAQAARLRHELREMEDRNRANWEASQRAEARVQELLTERDTLQKRLERKKRRR